VHEVQKIEDGRVNLIVLPSNQGKGSALRTGFKACNSEFVAFLDADLDIHPSAIVRAINLLSSSENSSVACAYGSKFHVDSKVDYPLVRRVASSFYRQLVKLMFGLYVEDTQTGVKVFRYDELDTALAHSKENRFLFDVELMAICNSFEYKMVPIPVALDYQYSSSINFRSAVVMIYDTVSLGLRLRRSN